LIQKIHVIIGVTIFLFVGIFTNSFEQAWAQDSESFAEDFFDDPISFFHPEDGKGFEFLLFIIGIAIYSLFVWYFYRFISRRNLLPKSFFPISFDRNIPKVKIAGYVVAYVLLFPALIFVWFTVLSFFVFLIAKDMPFNVAIFVSMAIIGVVRILSYYREDAAKEVAKMIPYAILSFLLMLIQIFSQKSNLVQYRIFS